MKHNLKTIIVTVAVAPLFFLMASSCAPENDFVAEDNTPVFPEPENASVAGTYFFETDGLAMEMEITESGGVLINERDYGDKRDTLKMLSYEYEKADIPIDSLIKLMNAVKDSTDLANEETSLLTNNLCRAWMPEKTFIKVKPKTMRPVGEVYDGCDLGEILNDVARRGADFRKFRQAKSYKALIEKAIDIQQNYSERASYMKVADITFTKAGTFVVSFEDSNPYVGTWHWEDEANRVFFCNFWIDGDEGEPVEVATTGQVSFNKYGLCNIVLDAGFSSDNIWYDAVVELVCSGEAKGRSDMK